MEKAWWNSFQREDHCYWRKSHYKKMSLHKTTAPTCELRQTPGVPNHRQFSFVSFQLSNLSSGLRQMWQWWRMKLSFCVALLQATWSQPYYGCMMELFPFLQERLLTPWMFWPFYLLTYLILVPTLAMWLMHSAQVKQGSPFMSNTLKPAAK